MRVRGAIALGLVFVVLAGPVGPGIASAESGGSSQSDCAFPYETTDATGTEVRLPAEPERVVTLRPSAAQTMWEIGAREKVVGVSRHAQYLEGAGEKANVSGPDQTVVVERVVALEPDLVLAPNTAGNETVEQLRGAGLTVYHFPLPETIDDVYEKTERIGRLVGACDGAEETVGRMRARLATVDAAVEGESRPDVLYAFFGFTAGEGTFIHEVIEAAGGNNVAAEYGVEGYQRLSDEVVVEADPDWIVRNSNDPVMPGGAPFNSTTAVREDQVVVVPIEHLNQPAPRIVEAITTLAGHFHPEAYASANTTATPTPAATPSPSPTASATQTTNEPTRSVSPSTETRGQSGFGVVAAVLAVAIALLSVRRRP